jgi:hypothetical protein
MGLLFPVLKDCFDVIDLQSLTTSRIQTGPYRCISGPQPLLIHRSVKEEGLVHCLSHFVEFKQESTDPIITIMSIPAYLQYTN